MLLHAQLRLTPTHTLPLAVSQMPPRGLSVKADDKSRGPLWRWLSREKLNSSSRRATARTASSLASLQKHNTHHKSLQHNNTLNSSCQQRRAKAGFIGCNVCAPGRHCAVLFMRSWSYTAVQLTCRPCRPSNNPFRATGVCTLPVNPRAHLWPRHLRGPTPKGIYA